MPGGHLIGVLFFVLLMVAAWTSSISLIEPAVTVLVENFRMTRLKASWLSGLTTWALGFGTIFSFNVWADYRLFQKNFFDLLDFLTANIMLPLGGLFLAIFAGWLMAKEASQPEFAMRTTLGFQIWHLLIRYIAPVAMLIIFFVAVGLL